MNEAQAVTLLDELRSTFPNTQLGNEGARQYVKALKGMSHELGREAVVSAIGTCRFLPTIADLQHHYGLAREQHRRRLEEERVRQERMAEDNHDWAADREFGREQLVRILHSLTDPTERLQLERVADGKCDDCPAQGTRFKFFSLGLCAKCIGRRLSVKAKVDEEAA